MGDVLTLEQVSEKLDANVLWAFKRSKEITDGMCGQPVGANFVYDDGWIRSGIYLPTHLDSEERAILQPRPGTDRRNWHATAEAVFVLYEDLKFHPSHDVCVVLSKGDEQVPPLYLQTRHTYKTKAGWGDPRSVKAFRGGGLVTNLDPDEYGCRPMISQAEYDSGRRNDDVTLDVMDKAKERFDYLMTYWQHIGQRDDFLNDDPFQDTVDVIQKREGDREYYKDLVYTLASNFPYECGKGAVSYTNARNILACYIMLNFGGFGGFEQMFFKNGSPIKPGSKDAKTIFEEVTTKGLFDISGVMFRRLQQRE